MEQLERHLIKLPETFEGIAIDRMDYSEVWPLMSVLTLILSLNLDWVALRLTTTTKTTISLGSPKRLLTQRIAARAAARGLIWQIGHGAQPEAIVFHTGIPMQGSAKCLRRPGKGKVGR